MLGFAMRLISGAFTPLIDQASTAGARLLRKLALFLLAGLCLLVVLIALTVAFALWIASMKGPIVATLAVAGLYFAVGGLAVFFATRNARQVESASASGSAPEAAAKDDLGADVDAFAEPLLQMLSRFGLRREQLAVLAGMSVAKQIGPVPLVGLAIVAGFLVGRAGKGLFPRDLIETLLASDLVSALFGRKNSDPADAFEADEQRDAA